MLECWHVRSQPLYNPRAVQVLHGSREDRAGRQAHNEEHNKEHATCSLARAVPLCTVSYQVRAGRGGRGGRCTPVGMLITLRPYQLKRTARKGAVLVAKAVERQEKGGVLALKAVETQGKGSVSLCPAQPAPRRSETTGAGASPGTAGDLQPVCQWRGDTAVS